ncbi:hypothetical protein LTR41_008000 [Exophiala xenobiotica]|nr:hypothetical protein LTR41_008000 [Exophiala xenobiotica]KAK5321085.1 hypothetical protein LTR93_006327 [Exophiala xenobiotica]
MSTNSEIKESNVDVLIIGAGPAGYMAAMWFAKLGVNARIIDKRSTKLFTGQADGLQPRVLEVFNSFGLVHRALQECSVGFEACYYEPDDEGKKIVRVDRKPEGVPGISRFNGSVVHQGRIEAWLTDCIDENSKGKMKVERPKKPESIIFDEEKLQDLEAYPISVLVKALTDDEATPEQYGSEIQNGLYRQFDGDQDRQTVGTSFEKINAKYVIGADGAHSWVRKQLGIIAEGESTDFVWGVLDMVPITDFPDIRKRCSIHSVNEGSIMVIPREKGIVRFYTQLKGTARHDENRTSEEQARDRAEGKTGSVARVDRSKVTAEKILETAQKIFANYKLEAAEVHWFTAYQIGQRVANSFQLHNRAFIVGDACHTHSPKAGQGMNVSMMDSFNLAWKIAHVIKGLAKPEILDTYQAERRQVAQDLIDFDIKLSRLYSGRHEVSTDEFRSLVELGNAFSTGCNVDYDKSILVDKPNPSELAPSRSFAGKVPFHHPFATRIAIGMRLPDTKFVCHCDGRPWFLCDRMSSDGRWRVITFIGDYKTYPVLEEQMQSLGEYLKSPGCFVSKYTPGLQRGADFDTVFENLLVHAASLQASEWEDFPQAWRPRDSRRVMDYWKIYADAEAPHGNTGDGYEKYEIDPSKGALVVVRPDGYVAVVTEPTLEGMKRVTKFFDDIMIPTIPNGL